MQPIDKIVDAWQRIRILDRSLIQVSIVLYWSKAHICFWNKEEG